MNALIQSLKPHVSQTEALRRFSVFGLGSIYRRLCTGPIQRIAEVYVPFHLYRVEYDLGREHQSRLFAIDAVNGSLDLFEFPSIPAHVDLHKIETRNSLPISLSEEQAQERLREKVLRVIFLQGFFKLRKANLTCTRESLALYFPYWLAFYGDKFVHCRVLDATRRRIEGAKASALFETWLAA
ncbi:MAG TPA: hypothetical protein VGG58_07465 [Candidatus Acidoferrum sp.]|jgi:hypothetical protein